MTAKVLIFLVHDLSQLQAKNLVDFVQLIRTRLSTLSQKEFVLPRSLV